MEYFRIILCGVLMASAVFTGLVSIYIYQKHNPAIRYFSLFSLSISFYSFGYAMELYSNTLEHMIFWNLVQYIGLPFLPALWVMFSLRYNNKHIRLITKLSLFLIPILTFIFRYTSNINQLFYKSVRLTANEYFPVMVIEKGPWYWVNVFFITFCFIVANFLYVELYRNSIGAIRRQSLLMLIASFLPWTTVILDLLNLSPLNIDYGPFAVTSSLMLFFIAFLRYQFLNIKPLARDKVFESTGDGIIVLDTDYNVIDFNPSAAQICTVLSGTCRDARKVFAGHEELVNSIMKEEESQFSTKEPKGTYKVNTVKISESDGREVGYIVTLTDITKYMDMMDELNLLASRDPLTGVFNRRYFVELCSNELEKSKRYHHPLSMVILDLDFFKQVNDNYGHLAGDAVLQTVADICRTSIRSSDILGRYGGEEFVICFPETTPEDCRRISGRILSNVSAAEIVHEDQEIKVTASLGITGVEAVNGESLDYFLKYADKALYEAKSDGRNCARSIAVES